METARTRRRSVFDAVLQFCVIHGIFLGCVAAGVLVLVGLGLLGAAIFEGSRAVLRRVQGWRPPAESHPPRPISAPAASD
jgi:hypothetical protein